MDDETGSHHPGEAPEERYKLFASHMSPAVASLRSFIVPDFNGWLNRLEMAASIDGTVTFACSR